MQRRPNPLIVALDFSEAEQAYHCARQLNGLAGMFKIGLELFCHSGPELVRKIAAECGPVFLDLKFHDIPNTVAGAVRAACLPGVAMLSVHISGGAAMLRRAVEAANEASQGKICTVGVTVLTSLNDDDLISLGFNGSTQAQVLRFVEMGLEAKLHGFICSAAEVTLVRAVAGKDKILVTPGIRAAGTDNADQKRTATARQAISDGANYIVVGRPITRAANPKQAAERILSEIG